MQNNNSTHSTNMNSAAYKQLKNDALKLITDARNFNTGFTAIQSIAAEAGITIVSDKPTDYLAQLARHASALEVEALTAEEVAKTEQIITGAKPRPGYEPSSRLGRVLLRGVSKIESALS